VLLPPHAVTTSNATSNSAMSLRRTIMTSLL